uniref:Uncharacterized protein n=1 Tax=Sphaerodactylus townsendi TaxID=933632 RepID=A0ACB8EFN8_9SAUR
MGTRKYIGGYNNTHAHPTGDCWPKLFHEVIVWINCKWLNTINTLSSFTVRRNKNEIGRTENTVPFKKQLLTMGLQTKCVVSTSQTKVEEAWSPLGKLMSIILSFPLNGTHHMRKVGRSQCSAGVTKPACVCYVKTPPQFP